MKTVKYFLPSWHAAEERPPHNGQYIVMTGLQNIRMAIWKDFCWFALGPPEVAGGVDLRDQTVVRFWSELPEAKEFQRHCRYLARRYGHIPTFFL